MKHRSVSATRSMAFVALWSIGAGVSSGSAAAWPTSPTWVAVIDVQGAGLSPEEIERAITIPIERRLAVIPHPECWSSRSMEGSSITLIAMKGIPAESVLASVTAALTKLSARLPAAATPPRISVHEPVSRLSPCLLTPQADSFFR